MRDVSPVDESRGRRAVSAQTNSNIPVLKKAPLAVRGASGSSAQKFWGGKVAPNSKVRWDVYSGEPTSSNAGKAGQVNPHTYAQESLSPPSDRKPMGYQVSVSGPQDNTKKNGASSERAERANRFGTRPPPVDTSISVAKTREPWKGASGRAEIVQPFKDQLPKKPLKSRREESPKSPDVSTANALSPSAAAVKGAPARADTAPVADDPEGFDSHDDPDDPIKPIVPLKVGRTTPPRSIAPPASPHYPATQSLASPVFPRGSAGLPPNSYATPITPTKNEHSGLKQEQTPEASIAPNTKVPRKSIESTPGSTASKDIGPTSRFSWTTYNTSTTYQHSPPPSPPPPLPDVAPSSRQQPLSAAASILNRKRPIAPSDKIPIRKPIVPTTARPLNMASSNPPSPGAASTFSTNTQKALPRPPTEISAADHVDILEAQMDDLRIRRSNVYRLLNDLNNMAPPNPLVTDFKRMRLVEKRKKDFEDELAEIKREEHDIGLKLHRAWRKRENADPGSESAIWIRRVTR